MMGSTSRNQRFRMKLSGLLAMVLAVVLLGGNVPVTAEPEVLSLSLQQAVEITLQDNPQVALARLGLDKARLALEQAQSTARKTEDAEELAGVTFTSAQARYVAPRAEQMGLLLAEKGLRSTEDGLRLETEKYYYDLLKADKTRENYRSALERAREQQRLAEAGLKAGTAAQSEVLGAQLAVAAAESDLTAKENAYQAALMQMNKQLNRPLTAPLQITDSFSFQPAQVNLDEALARAQADDLTLIGKRETVAVKEVLMEQAKRLLTPNTFSYRDAEFQLAEARLNLSQAEKSVEQTVRQAYLNLTAAEQGYQAAEKRVELAKENLRLAELRYQAGVGTYMEMRTAAGDLATAEAGLLETIYSHNLLQAQFSYGIFQ